MTKPIPLRFASALALALLVASTSIVTVPRVQAQVPEPAGANVDAHANLYASLQEQVDHKMVLDNMLATIARQIIESDASMAIAEQKSPGLGAALAEGMRPAMERYSTRVTALYRPRMIAMLRGELTADEAASVTEFYRSDTGRKLIAKVSRNYDGSAMIGEALNQQDISVGAVERDQKRLIAQTMGGMSVEERDALAAEIMTRPAMVKMQAVHAKMVPLRAEMENTPMTPEETALLEQGIRAAVAQLLEE